jgi:hypothetical protein
MRAPPTGDREREDGRLAAGTAMAPAGAKVRVFSVELLAAQSRVGDLVGDDSRKRGDAAREDSS